MLWIKDLNKYYKSSNGEKYHALRDINLTIEDSGFIVILGKSGSGKSTLLNVLGGLDHYDQGEMIIKNKSTKDLKGNEWDSYRNTYVGVVFQEFYIIEEYTVGKNIALALELQGHPKEGIEKRVLEILSHVDLEGLADRKPSEISGGQKQRIAIARALVKNPQIILADEPTGNLDSETGRLILNTLKKLSKEKLVIMVTHDQEMAKIFADRIIEIQDGSIINDEINESSVIDSVVELDDLSMIKIPSDGELSEQSIQYIAQYIERQENDVYLAISKNCHGQIHTIQSERISKQPKENNISRYNDTFQLKKSSLPLKHAFKLSMSSLLSKKIRLTFILLLFTLSLSFVGIAATISTYDVSVASLKTFENANLSYLPIQKQRYTCYKMIGNTECKDVGININDTELTKLKEKYPKLQFAKYYFFENDYDQIELPIDHSYNHNINYRYFKPSFSNVIIIDQNEAMFPLKYGDYPKSEYEIMITDFMANMIIEFNTIDEINRLEDVIGLTINQEKELKIVGIVKTDADQFDHLIHEENEQPFVDSNYNEIVRKYYHNLYMTKTAYDQLFLKVTLNNGMYITGWFNKILNATFIPTHSSYRDYLIGNSRLPMKDNEVLLPASAFESLYGVEENGNIEAEYERLIGIIGDSFDITIRLPIRTEEHGIRVKRSYKIVGIYDDQEFPGYWLTTKDEFETIDNYLLQNSVYGYVLLNNDSQQNIQLLRGFEEINYKHQSEYSAALYQVEEATEEIQKLFFIVGCILSVFTSFLIFSFISSSIKNKQKDIGTLRAIGARGFDVSKIFVLESLIIALISSICASIIMVYEINKINDTITFGFNIDLVLLYVNWLNILIVFGISFIVILLSTFIPMKRITIMKPINAIKKVN